MGPNVAFKVTLNYALKKSEQRSSSVCSCAKKKKSIADLPKGGVTRSNWGFKLVIEQDELVFFFNICC